MPGTLGCTMGEGRKLLSDEILGHINALNAS